MSFKVALFDADGVLTIHAESFSKRYAREKNIDYAGFKKFFQGEFQQALIGKADLKELVLKHEELWQAKDDIDGLLARWFAYEDVPNEPLLHIIARLRARGVPCYLATNQEQYRGQHIIDCMFDGLFDGYFVSAFVGNKKPSRDFFSTIIKNIASKHPGVTANDILFIDDSPEHIEGATALGINAHLYKGMKQAKRLLTHV